MESGLASTWLWRCCTLRRSSSQVPVFQFAGSIMEAIGIQGSLHLVLAAFVIRLTAYSTMALWPSVNIVLAVELLHGLTFGLAWAAGSEHCKRVAPVGLEATVQAAFQSCYFGLGTGSGGLVGGFVYQHYGPVACFLVAAGMVSAGWALSVIVEQCLPRQVHQKP